jgi:predicted dienelactone hydrolase
LLLRAAAGAAALGQWRRAQAAAHAESWRDPRRERELPVRTRWPDGDAPCALIVHSHGLGGNRTGGDVWGQAWQRAGFAVLHLQHPGSDTEVLRRGVQALRAAASAEQLRARVADMQFAVDEINRRAQQREPGWSRVRLDALGASGHSFGAVTVQALAGQRFPVATPRSAEPRFKAFVAFSPSLGHGLPAGEAFAGVIRPFLAVTGSLDRDALGRGLSGTDRARVYDALPGGQRALLWLERADHMSFAGHGEQPLRARVGLLKREAAAANLEALHHERVATLTSLWWRAKLLGDAGAAAALRAPAGLGEGDRWRQD